MIVPNPDEIPALASELKLEGTLAELCERKVSSECIL